MRYLRIGSRKITELPGEIGKLQHLETLDLRDCYYLLRLPSTVVQLQKLVRLLVSPTTRLPDVGFGSLQALEALEKLNICNTDNPLKFAEELGHLTKLRKLDIELEGEPFQRERLMGFLVSSISKLCKCNLRYLRIYDDIYGEIYKPLLCDPFRTYPYLQDLAMRSITKMVPKGMASLSNLVKLSIVVWIFDKEGLHLLMGMPSLAHLELVIQMPIKEKLTVCSNGFRLLKVFHYKYTHVRKEGPTDGLRVTFAPGSMPALRWLHLDLSPTTVASHFFAELGVEHLSGLAHLHVVIDCNQAAPGRVQGLESSIKKAIDLHPNCEIHVSRSFEGSMYKDDKEWEEAVAKDRKEMEEFRDKRMNSRDERPTNIAI